ncbi:Lipase 5 [Extremus antarcticus]|uniref:Lipase 5 n=1 Tax=Extremus antarcticus TaxID=702011 RepID=A0AAJ0GI65_9PEZI|nr:Lipase 5 [Extremus antarcticus]
MRCRHNDRDTPDRKEACAPSASRCLVATVACGLKTIFTWTTRSLLDGAKADNTPIEPRKLARISRLLQDLDIARGYKEKHRIEKQLYALRFDAEDEARRRESLLDAELLRSRALRLEDALEVDDLARLLEMIRTELRRNLGGMCNPALYDSPGVPTERTVARYQKAVRDALNAIVAGCLRNDERIDKENARRVLDTTRSSFGNTALCCSGGGTLGMIHVGIIKALHDAALEEFCHGDLAVFVGDHEPPGWLARSKYFLEHGAAFDSANLERVLKGHLGDMTFQEAYSRTGKKLNITVSTPDGDCTSHKVLHYDNSPNVVIWSAVVASCALPWAFKAGSLMVKDSDTKKIRPQLGGEQRIDGSFQGDIPLQRLNQDFDSNYFLVAQNNPHVLIAWRLRSTFGDGTLGQAVEHLSSAALREACHVLPRAGKYGRMLAAILDQPYSGDITIIPDLTLEGFWNVLANPTLDFMEAAKRIGELAIEPYIPMIKNHMKIERALEQACRDLTQACHFSESQTDLRLLHLEHAARTRRRRGSTQSVPGIGLRLVGKDKLKGHRRSETVLAAPPKPYVPPDTFEGDIGRQESPGSSSSDRRAKFSLDLDDES